MEFLLLGPFEVRDGERAVPLPRQKHRALLALLLLHAGEVLTADSLVEDLWGPSSPKTAREALHNYVSQLRKALGAGLIETRGTGYAVCVEPDAVDLLRFERLTRAARDEGSAELRSAALREALGLWRGNALADLVFEPFAAAEAGRLDELHVTAREDLLDAELELGRHADLVPELEALVAEHPFRERLRGQLMLALYRAGRQADALAAYREAREVLLAELGLDPGVRLRELEQAILRQDPALDLPAVLPPIEERRKTVTVLLGELAPASAGLDPERLRRETARALGEARAAIERHGGSVETRSGGELLGVFGIPTAHEDDALRAARAAVDVRDALPTARVGVDTGEVLAGHGFVSGEVVARAKRLLHAAAPGEVLLGEAARALCGDAVEVDGALRLVGVRPGVSPIARVPDAPLVGRTRELTALRRAYQEARADGRCRRVTVAGEPGIGKTRLARELVTEVEGEATVLVGRCVSYGDGATWLPLAEILEQAGERLETILAGASSPGEVFLATQLVLERLAAERPVVVVFDDLHWAEPTLLELVEHLAERAAGPILCLCLTRPELWAEGALVLDPLSDRQAEKLAAAVEPELRARLVSAAGGNPLFLEQLIAYTDGGGALDAVPPSLDALIAARLDLLPSEQLDVLQRASVVGLAFGRADLEELAAAVDQLPSLEEQRFVRRLRRGFRFHHVLVRDVVYASLPKAERAELHERLADLLDGRGGPDELVGYHLEQAFLYRDEVGLAGGRTRRLARDAGRRLGRAGLQAWKRGDASTTANLLGRAVRLLPEDDALALELLCELGPALRTGGDLSGAEETLARAQAAAAAAGERRLELRAGLELAAIRLFSDPDGRAEALLDAAAGAIPVFEAVRDDRSLGRAWLAVAVVHGPIRNTFGACATAAEEALAYYERSGWPTSTPQGLLAAAAYYGPMPVAEGVERCRALLERADLGGAANVLTFLAGLEAMRGRFDDARSLIAQAADTYAQLRQASAAAVNCGSLLGKIEVLAGDLAAAEAALTASCEALEQAGDRAYLATRRAELADVLVGLGKVEQAAVWVGRAEELAASDDVATQLVCRCVRARLRARDGAPDEAEALARDAVRLAGLTDAPAHGAKARLDLAGVLRLAGRLDEAAAEVEQAIDVLDRKGSTVAAEQARNLLTELATRR